MIMDLVSWFAVYVVVAAVLIDVSTAVVARWLTPKDRQDLDVWSNAAVGFGGIIVGVILATSDANTFMRWFGVLVTIGALGIAAGVIARSPLRIPGRVSA